MASVLIRFRVEVDNAKCKRCQICVKGCPAQAIKLRNNKIKINHRQCVLCLCCNEICPEGAVKINKNRVAKFAEFIKRCLFRQ